MGLRDALKDLKGAKLRWKINRIVWELRYAWQRAWRGYDDLDVFALDHRFYERMLLVLPEFKKRNVAEWPGITEEEQNQIINQLIYCFEHYNDEFVEIELYGTMYDDLPIEKITKLYETQHEKLQEGLDLFAKYGRYFNY